MEDNYDVIKQKFKLGIAISEIKNEDIKSQKSNFKLITRKTLIAACAFFALTTGFVFAKEIKNFIANNFGLGKGIETAVKNGYIANVEMNYVSSETINAELEELEDDGTMLENINSEIKIDDFLMDDYNLSIDFSILLNETISDYIDISSIDNITVTFPDLIITDENQNIIYTDCSENRFNEFCSENNLDYNYHEFNEKYMNTGLNNYLNYIDNLNGKYTISNKYNIYASTCFPKSQKLILNFNKIRIEKNTENNNDENKAIYTMVGNWNIKLDVPENMYNHSSEHYKVISCENENFNVYTAKVSDTGFEIGITINNTKQPSEPKELLSEFGTIYIFKTYVRYLIKLEEGKN